MSERATTGQPGPAPAPDFRALFESAPGLYLVLTPDLRIVAASDAYLRATMTRREEVLGRALFDVFPDNPDDPHATGVRNLSASLRRVLRDRAPDAMAVLKYDVRRPPAQGGGFEERYWSPVNSPVLGPKGEVAYLIHRVEDVTEFVRLEQRGIEQEKLAHQVRVRGEQMEAEIFLRAEELQEANRRLRQVNEELSRLKEGLQRRVEERTAELTRANEALRQSEQRFARFMQHLPGLAWIKNLHGRYVYANDAARKAFRTPGEELYGKTDEDVFPPETAAQFRENDRRALASRAGVQVIETLELEDGVLHHSIVSKFPILGPDGRPVLVGGMAIDVTDRVQAEQARRAAQEQLHIVTDSMSAPVTRCGRDLTYLWVSKPYADWQGRPPEEIVGRPIAEVLGPEAFGALRPYFERALAGEVVRYEEEVPYRGPGRRWINAVYTPTRDAAGRVDGWVAVVLDIDSRKRAEQALQEADRLKDEFLAMLAHELRNPLAPLRNALHILQQPGASGAALQEMRDMAERQVRHMARLLDDLLDVSRISRGKIELRKEVLDLTAAVNRSVEAVRPLYEERQHQLTVSLPPASLRVEADPTRLEQVVTNLLNNAAKYTDPGGKVWLTAEHAGAEVVLRVRDTGVGIAPDMLTKVFDLFVQAGRGPDRSQGGVGIGLTLVKKLVELHGGRVEASSEGPGRGSEFVVRLPAAPRRDEGRGMRDEGRTEEGPSGSSFIPHPSSLIPSCRVLVVDDNLDAADSLGLLLRLAGQEVRVAYDGPTALLLARSFRPEVVLLDLGMPGMDGYEAARRLRGQPESGAALLVALTGWGQDADRRRSAEAGFDHHLVKPVEPQALHELLADRKPAKA